MGDRRAGRNDIGTVNRRTGGRRVGKRLKRGDTRGRLRIDGTQRPAGVDGGNLRGARLFRRRRRVVPQAARIDDVNGGLRSLFALFSRRRFRLSGLADRYVSRSQLNRRGFRLCARHRHGLGGFGGERRATGGSLVADGGSAGALVVFVVRLGSEQGGQEARLALRRSTVAALFDVGAGKLVTGQRVAVGGDMHGAAVGE